MRLNKYISCAGVCSRRKADLLIASGMIEVNGAIVKEIGVNVKEGDVVKYRGKQLVIYSDFEYYILNKPINFITTCSDDRNRRTILKLVPNQIRVYPVGRLDRNTTGLLLLTNDGALTNKLTHPSFQLVKKYNVTLDRAISANDENLLNEGVYLEDGYFKFDKVNISDNRLNINVVMHSGKNRIIRRVFEKLSYRVKALDRYYYAGLSKGNLGLGRCRELTVDEVKFLKSL